MENVDKKIDLWPFTKLGNGEQNLWGYYEPKDCIKSEPDEVKWFIKGFDNDFL